MFARFKAYPSSSYLRLACFLKSDFFSLLLLLSVRLLLLEPLHLLYVHVFFALIESGTWKWFVFLSGRATKHFAILVRNRWETAITLYYCIIKAKSESKVVLCATVGYFIASRSFLDCLHIRPCCSMLPVFYRHFFFVCSTSLYIERMQLFIFFFRSALFFRFLVWNPFYEVKLKLQIKTTFTLIVLSVAYLFIFRWLLIFLCEK